MRHHSELLELLQLHTFFFFFEIKTFQKDLHGRYETNKSHTPRVALLSFRLFFFINEK